MIDGKAIAEPVTKAPYAITWDTTSATAGGHTITAVATDTSGNKTTSGPIAVTVENPAGEEPPCFVMDAKVTADGVGTAVTPGFTTASPEEQLLAFVGSDGPPGANQQSVTVSGAGLEWSLVRRANSRSGDAEIWTARAPTALQNVSVTSTQAVSGYNQSLTVVSVQESSGIGASASAGAATGAPKVSLKTNGASSLAFAVGSDYTQPLQRTLGTNQVSLHEYLAGSGDTFWSQYLGQVTGAAGTTITLNDTAPTNDEWNMAEVELLGGH
jgi:hypothetical protein